MGRPSQLGLSRVDEIEATGRVATFNAQVAPSGETSERSAGYAQTARIELRRYDD